MTKNIKPINSRQKLPPRASLSFACGTDRNKDSGDMRTLFTKAHALRWFALPAQSVIYLARQNIDLPPQSLIFTQLDMLCGAQHNDRAYQAALETAFAYFRPCYVLDRFILPDSLTPPQLDRLIARVQAHNRQFGGALLLQVPYVEAQGQAFAAVADVLSHVAVETGCKLAVNLNQLYMACQYHNQPPRPFIDALQADTIALIEMGDGIEAICHEVWVLYTHLLERVGPRPTLIGTYTGRLSLSSLLADMHRADDRLNATRTLGPQLGASHVIFK